MKVRIRTLFNVDKGDGMPTRTDTALEIYMYMPFPPQVGLDLSVGEDDIAISQVVFDHKTQRYSAWCEYDAESKGEIEDAIKQFVKHGWHIPYSERLNDNE